MARRRGPVALARGRWLALWLGVALAGGSGAETTPAGLAGDRGPPSEAVEPATGTGLETGPAGALEVIATASPVQAWVGQQVLLVIQVRDRAPPRGLLEPLTGIAADVLPLGEERRQEPAAADTPPRAVFERRLALFPRSPGPLSIPALTFWDDAGRQGASAALTLQVLPPPADAGPGPWLPAQDLRLGEAGPARVRMAPGQGIARLITLRAEGLPAEALPPVPLAFPVGLELGRDPPRLWNERRPDGIVGHRTERLFLGAPAVGEYLSTARPLRWWNTERGEWAFATLPDWHLVVAPFASADRRLTPTWRSDGLGPVEGPPLPVAAPRPRPWWSRWSVWAGMLVLVAAGWLVHRRLTAR